MIFNDYLTSIEKEATVNIYNVNANMFKLKTLYEAVDADYRANTICAEAKVFSENGTYDDLETLYIEAGEDANAKKENILQKMIHVLKDFVDKVISFFKEKCSKLAPGDVKGPKNLEEDTNLLLKIWNTIKSFCQKLASKSISAILKLKDASFDFFEKHKAAVIIGTSAVGGGIALVKINKATANFIKKSSEKAVKEIKDVIDKLEKILPWVKTLKSDKKEDDEEKNTGITKSKSVAAKGALINVENAIIAGFEKALDGLKWLLGKFQAVGSAIATAIVKAAKKTTGKSDESNSNDDATEYTSLASAAAGYGKYDDDDSYEFGSTNDIFGLDIDDFMSFESSVSNEPVSNLDEAWSILSSL